MWLTALCYTVALISFCSAIGIKRDQRVRTLLGGVGPVSGMRASLPSVLPHLWRSFAEGIRSRLARRGPADAVPDLLDLLAVSVTAGLSPRQALDRAADVIDGPCGRALQDVRREVSLGSPWHTALEGAAHTAGVPEFGRLAGTLQRAERLGSPLADRLRDLASEVRTERRVGREERARQAPVRMLFPLVFLILPAFVVSAVVPALIVATRDVI